MRSTSFRSSTTSSSLLDSESRTTSTLVRRDSTTTTRTRRRTLADVRTQVAQEVAIRAITKSELLDDIKVGVSLTLSKNYDGRFLDQVASTIKHTLLLQHYLFAIAATGSPADPNANSLLICGSDEEIIQRAALLASSKFLGRVKVVHHDDRAWAASVQDIGTSTYDEEALWDIVRKSARTPIDPLSPPPGSRGIDEILSAARAKLQRITPRQAYNEFHDPPLPVPVFLVDIRSAEQREREGCIHGSLVIERNVLEWRFDPRSDARLAVVDRYDLRVIVFCQDGQSSSLAAFALHEIGLLNATDMIGGFQAWKEERLPFDEAVTRSPTSAVPVTLHTSDLQ